MYDFTPLTGFVKCTNLILYPDCTMQSHTIICVYVLNVFIVQQMLLLNSAESVRL